MTPDALAGASRALQVFGIAPLAPPRSLYAYAPVWRFRDAHGDWVLKQTGRAFSSGPAIARWTSDLARQGLATVCPAPTFAPNPRPDPVEVGLWWVVYPFVAGQPYLGTPRQIGAAGDLLGRLHAEPEDPDTALNTVTRLPEQDPASRAAGLATLRAQLRPVLAAQTDRLALTIEASTPGDHAALPLVAGSFDFKAANLVYRTETAPVLIDPDHAARLPRLLDLATALILFHNDAPQAPARLWTRSEWALFYRAYSRHVTLTSAEGAAWPAVCREVWAQQSLWLLGHWPEGWDDPRERAYLLALVQTDLGLYRV